MRISGSKNPRHSIDKNEIILSNNRADNSDEAPPPATPAEGPGVGHDDRLDRHAPPALAVVRQQRQDGRGNAGRQFNSINSV